MASQAEDSAAWASLKVPVVIAFYMVSALMMIFVNKTVLNSTPDLPLTFLAIQLLIAVVLLNGVSFIAYRFPTHPLSEKCRLPLIDLATVRTLAPFVFVGVTGLAFNTLCLANVDAAFFQIARGMLLPLTAVVSALHTRTTPTWQAILSIAIVSVGYFVGVAPSSYFNSSTAQVAPLLSLIYGTLSSLFLAVHAVLVKPAAKAVDNKAITLVYYGNLMSAFVMVPLLVLNGEVGPFLRLMFSGGEQATVFTYGSAVTGVFGFFIGLATILSIKVTSPVSHMFSSAARTVIQTVLSVYIFGEIVTAQRGLSILVILAGTLYYTWVQANTPREKKPEPPQPLQEIDIEKAQGLGEFKDAETPKEDLLFSPFREQQGQGHHSPSLSQSSSEGRSPVMPQMLRRQSSGPGLN